MFILPRMLTLLNIKYPKSRMCCQKTACGQYFSFWYSTVMFVKKWRSTKTKTNTKTMTNTFKEHLQRAILEIFGLWDIWSERWEYMTWPTKRQQQRRRQVQWQKHLENTPNEGFLETFWEHPRMVIQEKFWVWPIIHCYEFSQTLPDQTGGGWPRVDDYWTLRPGDVEARWHYVHLMETFWI